jgi:hypothetical protein
MQDDEAYLGWCVVIPPGVLGRRRPQVTVELGPCATEADAWRIALGWPTRGEVREAMGAGAHAFRCRVVPAEEAAADHAPVAEAVATPP